MVGHIRQNRVKNLTYRRNTIPSKSENISREGEKDKISNLTLSKITTISKRNKK